MPLVRAQRELVMLGNWLNRSLFCCGVRVSFHQSWALGEPARVPTGPSVARDEEDGHVPTEGSPRPSSEPLARLPHPSGAG